MKKLFLYITLFTVIFIIAFSLSEQYFDDHARNNTKLTATETTGGNLSDSDNTATFVDSTAYIQAGISGYVALADNTSTVTSEEDIPVDTFTSNNQINKTNYIVTIKNGYIIVYENSIENIYEYTGIEAETIRITDVETYNKLNESLIFNTREDLFDFLESIAG